MVKLKSYVKKYLKEVNDNGFSLLELVVAVGVLLVLTVGGLLAYNGITKNARTAAVQSAADEVYTGAVAEEANGGKAKDAVDEWDKTAKKDKNNDPVIKVVSTGAGDTLCVEANMTGYDEIEASKGPGCKNVGSDTENSGDNENNPGGETGNPSNPGGSENGGETTPPVIVEEDVEVEVRLDFNASAVRTENAQNGAYVKFNGPGGFYSEYEDMYDIRSTMSFSDSMYIELPAGEVEDYVVSFRFAINDEGDTGSNEWITPELDMVCEYDEGAAVIDCSADLETNWSSSGGYSYNLGGSGWVMSPRG